MSWFHPSTLLDKVFEGGILLKGATGVVEFLSGTVLFFVSPDKIHHFVNFITQRELLQDPHDKIALALIHSTQNFGSGSKVFAIAYLWVHAVIKLIAVIGLLKNMLWAYPFSLITLGILLMYQLLSIVFISMSIGMILLSIFDVFILWLIWREYQKVRFKNAQI